MRYDGSIPFGVVGARAGSVGDPVLPAAISGPSGAFGGADVPGFTQALWQAVQSVDGMSQEAGERMAAVDSGRSDDLPGAMLASQEASLSFSMLMQVRNKVMGAVDELIKLPL